MAVNVNPTQAYAYAETLEILSLMDKSDVNKIPQKLIDIFEKNADPNYISHIDASIPLDDQNLSSKTDAILGMLALNYWCDSEEEKKSLKNAFIENERKYQDEINKKYSYENIFNDNVNDAVENNISEQSTSSIEDVGPITQPSLEVSNVQIDTSNLPMDYSSFPWYKKLFTNIKNFIYKLFNRKK